MITRKWTRIAVSGAIAATMLMSAFVQDQAEAAPKKEMELNINHWIVTTDVNPVILNQTTLVPLRVMKYYMKPMQLHWNNKNKTVTVNTGADQVTLEMGSLKAKGKGKAYSLSIPAALKDGHVMVPIRFIAELYDAEVGWDTKERMIYIYTPDVDVSTAEENGYVKLYPVSATKYGRYEGMVVEVEGRKRVFEDWNGGDGTRKPVIQYRDVTGDGKPDVVVFYVDGTGTGLYMGEMHVVDAETLKEIPIESLEQAVLNHVQSNIEKYADHFVIKLLIDGKEYVQRIEDDSKDKSYLYDKLGFGAVVRHSLVEGRLVTEAAGSISPAGFAGDLQITYRFDEELNQFVVDSMEYSSLEE
ncbi:copper amine oxidase N-terminal domain-containing protein [Paenibacillus lautus]|uniref:copper amine oxidase N-terminal domain-containing protein n=1 Tax=Paenibacillus lautus TaxID=1401 RepID=UPI000FDA0BE9|nr:copper amine oxidase N-terminal domain-containing protein [Paenibacillus lautus]